MKSLIPIYVKVQTRLHSILKDETGATMVEYALMVALIAVAAFVAVQTLGTNVSGEFNKVAGYVNK